MKGQKDRKSKAKALSLPSLLGLRYLGRSDFADAGFLRQRPDAADKAERVRELLPAGLKDWALGRWHKLRRIAPRPRACHGNTRGPSGGGGREEQVEKGWLKPTEPSHVSWHGPKLIFSDKNRSTQEPHNRFLFSFVIVSFGVFPLWVRTFPEVNVLSNPSATTETEFLRSNATPRRRAFLLSLFAGSRVWFLVSSSAKVPRCPTTSSGTPRRSHELSFRKESAERKAAGAKGDALFRRGGMCNASEGRGSASGEEGSVPLCV